MCEEAAIVEDIEAEWKGQLRIGERAERWRG